MVTVNSSENRDFSVGIVIRLRAGRSGVRIPVLSRDFYLLQVVQIGCGTHLAFYSVGTGELKRPDCAVNHSTSV